MQQDPGFTLNGTRVLLFFVCFTLLLFFIGKNELRCQEVKHKGKVVIQELDAFVKELERIRDQYREQDRFPQNAFVEGVINPGNRKFTLVTRDGKMRLDIEKFIFSGFNKKPERRTIINLHDGQNFYVLNKNTIVISNPDLNYLDWRSDSTNEVHQFYMPDLYDIEPVDDIRPVDEYCDSLLQIIRADPVNKEKLIKAIASGQVILHITKDGPLHTVEVCGPMADDGSGRIDSRRIVLDERYGYLPVQSLRIEMPAPGASAWKKTYQIQTQYQEVAPGIYFLSQGRSEYDYHNPKIDNVEKESDSYSYATIVKKSETGTEINKRTIHSRTDIKITKVKRGNFEIAEDYFDPKSLKINPGIHVSDRRARPPLSYTYSESHLDVKNLNDTLWNKRSILAR
ncbi:hypothetical protein Pan241w_48680 [Gimesia alba]|uniref:Uncharacterized protein n=1 Tax=Gimesia alba TaxID=2527973 RepID=A0A517RLQ7_9PLAN|nr:hypothetical protein [Gimesia alba]QDT44752.1 hypothetical protein Pan241w_48680 [Gimesia alba]